jgi:hypothetical protein
MRNSTPQRRQRNAAEAEAVATLKLYVHACEWCCFGPPSDPHHVAQGSNKHNAVGDVRLILLLCRPCHDEIHRLSAANRAIGLALLRLSGRLQDLQVFYDATGRNAFPPEREVRLWERRLTRSGR